MPLADGQPVLKGCVLLEGSYRANILAVRVLGPGSSKAEMLRLFRAGIPLAEYPVKRSAHGFALSADGKLLARQVGDSCVEVREIDTSDRRVAMTLAEGFTPRANLMLGDACLGVLTGKQHVHLVRWDTGTLRLVQQSALVGR